MSLLHSRYGLGTCVDHLGSVFGELAGNLTMSIRYLYSKKRSMRDKSQNYMKVLLDLSYSMKRRICTTWLLSPSSTIFLTPSRLSCLTSTAVICDILNCGIILIPTYFTRKKEAQKRQPLAYIYQVILYSVCLKPIRKLKADTMIR